MKFLVIGLVCYCLVVPSSVFALDLPSGKNVYVKFDKEYRVGNKAKVSVSEDVKDADGNIVIAKGAKVDIDGRSLKRRGLGQPGELKITGGEVETVSGVEMELEADEYYHGRKRVGLAIGLGVGLGLLAWPLLACLAIKGKPLVIQAGTKFKMEIE